MNSKTLTSKLCDQDICSFILFCSLIEANYREQKL